MEKKLKYLERTLSSFSPDTDIFDKLLALTKAGLKFAEENPRLNDIAQNFTLETDQALKAKVMDVLGPPGTTMMADLFREALDKGQVDRRVKPFSAGYSIMAVITALGEDLRTGRLDTSQVMFLVSEIFDVLKFGYVLLYHVTGRSYDRVVTSSEVSR